MKTFITIILFLLSRLTGLAQEPHPRLLPGRDADTSQSAGNACLIKKQYGKAKYYLLKALKEYERDGDVKKVHDVTLLLFKTDSAAGNYQSAISYLQQSDRLKDSMLNLIKSKQIKDLQIAYATEHKNKYIRDLKNSAKVRQLNLAHASSARIWTIIGAALLLVNAGLLLRQGMAAKRNNAAIDRKNEMLQHLITEKEWLLKEVHDRVKNNLHTVICLLESQAKYLENDALNAVESCQHRIFAMSLIHQKLYRTDHVKTIDMTEYIPELINNLEASFGVEGFVSFKFNIDPVVLDISYAIPLALIMNEAVTNAIKYAFPGYKAGEIQITLVNDSDQIKLQISDNGIGLSEDPCCTAYNSLGMELMKGLSAEINGVIRFENLGGTRISIIFIPSLQV
ncbi:Two-component sensor histidine kinase, contains HisKA and HATPase domains [Mucilaginibacter gossypiicola]|uniref:histidine kinase n=1 Tax=Mucilaginibacter gossypiicola TaxID=551995 RepID=A0A1H8NVM4_9SPHI|nr:sensor histidine kinase [Mucilaginibacter gossypiicola]SEO33720.1 Two-component sensor histidine kinase, contains HisKA and HATPase domains [Mucilaginibacter gossypiicola]